MRLHSVALRLFCHQEGWLACSQQLGGPPDRGTRPNPLIPHPIQSVGAHSSPPTAHTHLSHALNPPFLREYVGFGIGSLGRTGTGTGLPTVHPSSLLAAMARHCGGRGIGMQWAVARETKRTQAHGTSGRDAGSEHAHLEVLVVGRGSESAFAERGCLWEANADGPGGRSQRRSRE